MDYKELSEHSGEKRQVTMVVCRDKWTNVVEAFVAKAKGSVEIAKRCVEYLDSFGY